MLRSLPLRPGVDAAILAKLDAMEKPRTGKRGPGLFRFRMGGTSDGRECRHHHLGMVAFMPGAKGRVGSFKRHLAAASPLSAVRQSASRFRSACRG